MQRKLNYRWICSLLATTLFASLEATAQSGLLGGNYYPSGTVIVYGAQLFVYDNLADSTVVQLPFSTLTGLASVAINPSGAGIIGGTVNHTTYAALVSPSGAMTPFTLSGDGVIESVSINSSGAAIIGGRLSTALGDPQPYAALVTPSGSLNELDLSSVDPAIGIFTVAINDAGRSLIGGYPTTAGAGYLASATSSGGTPNAIATQRIYSVAINSSGIGLAGGQNALNNHFYATFVASDDTPTALDLPASTGIIRGVAINDGGAGLIGGSSGSSSPFVPYAASVTSGSTSPTPFSNLPAQGLISSVAINEAGAGLLGGFNGSGASLAPYAALVSPNSTVVTPLSLPTVGHISSVAINEAGVGLIGGYTGVSTTYPYAALVAPNGTVTPLSLPTVQGTIRSVALNDLVSEVAPTVIGSYLNAINSQLAASMALESHFTARAKFYQPPVPNNAIALVADLSDITHSPVAPDTHSPHSFIWLSPFGDYVAQGANGANPSTTNTIGGILLGYDYSWCRLMVGAALGYAYSYAHYGNSVGHGTVQEELLTFYGSYEWPHCRINWAAWGGYYQLTNERHTPTLSFTSNSSCNGWLCSPHFEIATPWALRQTCWSFIEPYALFDWVNNWQEGYTESGASGFNIVMNSQYTSLLRSEAGLRFYQVLSCSSGRWIFKEEGSYINQTPFNTGNATTHFVASPSSFPIAIGNGSMENLGGVGFQLTFLPTEPRTPYVTIDAQGEWGSGYQAYFGNIEIGKAF